MTKASVSKWETGQSTPDIMLLPQLAAYFDVSVDALLGYEPQLTREQIDRLYKELSQGFAEQPLAEMLEKTKKLVKQYYSCYSFLFQICVLWLNHCTMLAPEERSALLQEILKLCGHITENCEDFSIREETVVMRAQVNLILGKRKRGNTGAGRGPECCTAYGAAPEIYAFAGLSDDGRTGPGSRLCAALHV